MATKKIRRRQSHFRVLPIAEGESSHLVFTLPRARGRHVVYALRGFIEFEMRARARTPTIVRAYGTASLRASEPVEGMPADMDFRLARPTRANLSGRPFTAALEFTYPKLAKLKKHRIVSRTAHMDGIRPVKASIKLSALWANGFGGLLISGIGRIPIPTISEVPLLASCILACLCPPKKPKCKTLCLNIKVGPRAAGGQAVMKKEEVKAVIKRVNEIWGCKDPGQCCINFTVDDGDITLNPPGLASSVKVQTSALDPAHEAAIKIARSDKCYNVYYVENIVPGTTPGITTYGNNPEAVLVQFPPNAGYTNETLATLTAHELGHALGLARDPNGTDDDGVEKHSKNSPNVMHNIANLGAKLNAKQCARARESKLLKDTDDDCTPNPKET